MMRKCFLLLSVMNLMTSQLEACALEKQPWFGDVYEFFLHTGYAFSWFRKVDGAEEQLKSTSLDNLWFADLEFATSPQWSFDLEGEIAQTPRQPFGPRSVAFQSRYLMYDDIIGDPFSLALGANVRYIFPIAVRDISCPYGANFDFIANISIGKEFDFRGDWRYRLWSYGSVGVANEGSPWIRGIGAFEMNCSDVHKWAFFVDALKGYGEKTVVDIDNFHGYASIRRTYLDLAVRYGYGMGVWGTLRLEYIRRIVAVRCPEKMDMLVLSWLVSFSF